MIHRFLRKTKMIKKITLLIVLTLSLSFIPLNTEFNVPVASAGNVNLNPNNVTPNNTSNPNPSLDSGGFMFSLTPIVNQNIEGSVKQSWIRQGINYFFENVIGFMAAVIGTLCVLMMSLGGFLMIISGGNEVRYEQGKNYVIYSLIGLGVTLSAYILVTLVQLLIRSIYG